MMYLYKRIYALQSQGSRQSHLKKGDYTYFILIAGNK
jgi:hypothetical protein